MVKLLIIITYVTRNNRLLYLVMDGDITKVKWEYIVRIFNGSEVQIENSVTRVTVWHYEA